MSAPAEPMESCGLVLEPHVDKVMEEVWLGVWGRVQCWLRKKDEHGRPVRDPRNFPFARTPMRNCSLRESPDDESPLKSELKPGTLIWCSKAKTDKVFVIVWSDNVPEGERDSGWVRARYVGSAGEIPDEASQEHHPLGPAFWVGHTVFTPEAAQTPFFASWAMSILANETTRDDWNCEGAYFALSLDNGAFRPSGEAAPFLDLLHAEGDALDEYFVYWASQWHHITIGYIEGVSTATRDSTQQILQERLEAIVSLLRETSAEEVRQRLPKLLVPQFRRLHFQGEELAFKDIAPCRLDDLLQSGAVPLHKDERAQRATEQCPHGPSPKQHYLRLMRRDKRREAEVKELTEKGAEWAHHRGYQDLLLAFYPNTCLDTHEEAFCTPLRILTYALRSCLLYECKELWAERKRRQGGPARVVIDDTCPTDEEHLVEEFLTCAPASFAPRVKLVSDVLDTGRHHITQHCSHMMTTWKYARDALDINRQPQVDALAETVLSEICSSKEKGPWNLWRKRSSYDTGKVCVSED